MPRMDGHEEKPRTSKYLSRSVGARCNGPSMGCSYGAARKAVGRLGHQELKGGGRSLQPKRFSLHAAAPTKREE